MRVLLDTNIVIHRENNKVSNSNIGSLFYWLDKMKYVKLIHPFTIEEIKKFDNSEILKVLMVKLESYTIIKTIIEPDNEFIELTGYTVKSFNDIVDNTLLYEVSKGRVNLLITEDKLLIKKAEALNIKDKVFRIEEFLEKITSENPDLIPYRMLAIKKKHFGDIDLNDNFFDSFKNDYKEFEKWFNEKCDEEAYTFESDDSSILGFLYLKKENENDDYSDINPPFTKCKRLKIGTFKVIATGFRLGERFLKIIYDNALQMKVDEIYVTLFSDRDELDALSNLFITWGFIEYGNKSTKNGIEKVLVKYLNTYDNEKSPKENYPNIIYNNRQKFILPIYPEFHTDLFPDSILRTEKEENFNKNLAHRYALSKVYISWSPERDIKKGDILLFYRMGEPKRKSYTSTITSVGIIDKILYNFNNEEEFLLSCKNRSIFTFDQLKSFWISHRNKLMVIEFIFVTTLEKKIILKELYEMDIIKAYSGPRPFHRLDDNQFNRIMELAKTDLNFIDKKGVE